MGTDNQINEPTELRTGPDGEMVALTSSGTTIEVPLELKDGLEISDANGAEYVITLPNDTEALPAVEMDNGAVAFPSESESVNSVVPNEDGIQLLTTILGDRAPESYNYEIELPEGAELRLDSESGSVNAVDVDGSWLFGAAPPWAVDATGKSVPTHYEVRGNALTQVVSHTNVEEITYPIVADPLFSFDLIKSFKWVKSGKGYTISVAVTPAMGFASVSGARLSGWNELKKKVKSKEPKTLSRLNKGAMQLQWECHAYGKIAIGIGGWTGIDKKPTWDLETWRPTVINPAKMVIKKCNW